MSVMSVSAAQISAATNSQCVDCQADITNLYCAVTKDMTSHLSVSWDCTTGCVPRDSLLSHSVT
jgi:hypothetical protein